MKNSNFLFEGMPCFKMGFLSFLLTFLFFTGIQTDTKAQGMKGLYEVPAGTFVAVAVAKARLNDALVNLKTQIHQLAPGSTEYINTGRRYAYYNQILTTLGDGSGRSVPESIAYSLGRITTILNDPASDEQALVEKDAAISLLRQ